MRPSAARGHATGGNHELDSTSGDDKYQARAFHIVADVSYSMQESGAIIAANTLLKEMHDAIAAAPVIANVVRLGLIDFSDDGRAGLPVPSTGKPTGPAGPARTGTGWRLVPGTG